MSDEFYYRLNFLEYDLKDRVRVLKLSLENSSQSIQALPLTGNSTLTLLSRWLEDLYYEDITSYSAEDLAEIASSLYWKKDALEEILYKPDSLPNKLQEHSSWVLAYALFIYSRTFPVKLTPPEEFVLEDLLSSYTGKDKLDCPDTQNLFVRLFNHAYDYMSRPTLSETV